MPRVILHQISSRAWEHPADRAALNTLRAIPGFDEVVRKIASFFGERGVRQLFLANAVRVGPKQRPRLNQIYSEMRGLKHEETFAANGQILHEIYFSILGGDGQETGDVVDKIKEDFGTLAAWREDFVASAMCARGWVVLAYDPTDGHLHNFIGDAQNQGGVWGAIPVLNCDTYEHSYFIDYGSDRKTYVEAFLRNINWAEVNRRYLAAANMVMAKK